MQQLSKHTSDIVNPVTLTYFKRYRMEIDPQELKPDTDELFERYRFLTWHENLLTKHAAVKFESFRSEVDANVFPCLGEADGCHRLMIEISQREGFLPLATWLVEYFDFDADAFVPVGTVQGVCDRYGFGAIQNLGIIPEHRGQGLGTVLLKKAMQGFCRAGLERAYLEVTAQNEAAIRLYQRLGLEITKTVYKAVEIPLASKQLLGL